MDKAEFSRILEEVYNKGFEAAAYSGMEYPEGRYDFYEQVDLDYFFEKIGLKNE
jgi:hypothetical protein